MAHRNRYHPALLAIDRILQNDGEMRIGRLLEIRGRGKSDRRGGGEDLWVLGSHVLDLFSYFAGRPLSCSAEIREKVVLVGKEHIRPGNEALGPLAGDEIHARFQMEKGVVAYWDSLQNDGTANKGFGLKLIGSEGGVLLHCDGQPLAHYKKGNPFDAGTEEAWQVVGNEQLELIEEVRNHQVPCKDLIAAVQEPAKREPICGIREAGTITEMIMAVFASQMDGGRSVEMPLSERKHPFGDS